MTDAELDGLFQGWCFRNKVYAFRNENGTVSLDGEISLPDLAAFFEGAALEKAARIAEDAARDHTYEATKRDGTPKRRWDDFEVQSVFRGGCRLAAACIRAAVPAKSE